MRLLFILFWVLFFGFSVEAQTKKYGAWFFRQACSKITVNGLGLAITSGGYCDKDNLQITNGIQFDILGRGIIPPIIYTTTEEMEIYEDSLRVMQKINGLAVSPGGLAFMGTLINGINLFGISTMCGKVNGVSAGGLLSYNLWTNGISISLFNVVLYKMSGLQIGGISSATQMNGLQIGGLCGAESMSGLQIGGLCDAQSMNGIQIGGGCGTKRMKGVQIGGFCRAEHLNGLQFGGTNFNGKHHGVQIGLFNKTKTLKGIQIGLWNISDKRALPFLNFQF